MILSPNHHNRFTVIVCGAAQSGSSLVAGSLRLLDVYMGSEFTPEDSHQDIDFCRASFDASLVRAIKKRNASYWVWGFKWVGLSYWLNQAMPHLVNPAFVYCHRNLSDSLNSGSPYKSSKVAAFTDHLTEVAFLSEFFRSNAVPLMLAEYGQDKMTLFEELAEFTHADLTPEILSKLTEFSTGGYRKMPC